MPIVPVYLNVDESTYAGVQNGVLELCGMAKNIDSKRVAKHIPTVVDSAKDGASKAIDFIRGHKKETFLVGGILIVGGAIFGTITYASYRKLHKLEIQFGNALQVYLDAARDGALNIEILNTLIDSIEAIENNSPQKAINLNISSSQFNELIHCIFDYTLRMANANSFNAKIINRPKYFKKKTSDDLKYYLNMQKQIFEQAA